MASPGYGWGLGRSILSLAAIGYTFYLHRKVQHLEKCVQELKDKEELKGINAASPLSASECEYKEVTDALESEFEEVTDALESEFEEVTDASESETEFIGRDLFGSASPFSASPVWWHDNPLYDKTPTRFTASAA